MWHSDTCNYEWQQSFPFSYIILIIDSLSAFLFFFHSLTVIFAMHISVLGNSKVSSCHHHLLRPYSRHILYSFRFFERSTATKILARGGVYLISKILPSLSILPLILSSLSFSLTSFNLFLCLALIFGRLPHFKLPSHPPYCLLPLNKWKRKQQTVNALYSLFVCSVFFRGKLFMIVKLADCKVIRNYRGRISQLAFVLRSTTSISQQLTIKT